MDFPIEFRGSYVFERYKIDRSIFSNAISPIFKKGYTIYFSFDFIPLDEVDRVDKLLQKYGEVEAALDKWERDVEKFKKANGGAELGDATMNFSVRKLVP